MMAIPLTDQPPGRNVLEGLAFNKEGHLYVCVPVQSLIYKVDVDTQTVLQIITLPDHLLPAALKIHRDGRLFVAAVGSDNGSQIAILSPEGILQERILMPGRHIDDLVFDRHGGFYCSDLSGTLNDRKAGIYYVAPDHQTITPIITSGLIKTNGIALTPDEQGLWFTEFAASTLNKIQFGYDGFAEEPYKTFTPYHFTGLEGPDSMCIDEDGNVYVAMTGQGRCMVFNPMGIPIGEIHIPGRQQGKMLKCTHITIRPDTNIAYIYSADMNTGEACLYRAGVYAKAHKGFMFQDE